MEEKNGPPGRLHHLGSASPFVDGHYCGLKIVQKEFARRIGVSQGHLSYIDGGEKEIGAEILLRISREFGKSIEWILAGEG